MKLNYITNYLKANWGCVWLSKVIIGLAVLNGIYGLTGHFKGLSMSIGVALLVISIARHVMAKKKLKELQYKQQDSANAESTSVPKLKINEMYFDRAKIFLNDGNVNFNIDFTNKTGSMQTCFIGSICYQQDIEDTVRNKHVLISNYQLYINGVEEHCFYYIENKPVDYESFINNVHTNFICQNLLKDIKKLKGVE